MNNRDAMEAVLHAGATVMLAGFVARRLTRRCRLSSKGEDLEGCTVIVEDAEPATTAAGLLDEMRGSFRVTWAELVNDLGLLAKLSEVAR